VARLLSRASLCLGAAACASTGAAEPGDTPPANDGPAAAVYTTQQADRGERVFTTVCTTCHGPNEFTGPIFELTWMAEPVGHLYQHISTAMPQDQPGSLLAEEYVDIVAYFLRLNGRPAGERELPADVAVLNRMVW
jgi:mono/diheme cytochrome c family protein